MAYCKISFINLTSKTKYMFTIMKTSRCNFKIFYFTIFCFLGDIVFKVVLSPINHR